MRAQMVTGLFQYEPCDLQVENEELHIKFLNTSQILHIPILSEAILTRSQKGLYQLQLSTAECQYEFLVEDERQAKEALAALMKLTKDHSRLEVRSIE